MKFPIGKSLLLLTLAPPGCAFAAVSFNVTYNDPGSIYSSYYENLTKTITAAGLDLTSNFLMTGSPLLNINVNFASIPTVSGASSTTHFVAYDNSVAVFEQGAAYRIEGGSALPGASDVVFNIGVNGYLQNELFFDSDPFSRSALIPSNQTDAFSVFEHEFSHAFAFNGFRNGQSGNLPGAYESTFDRLVIESTISGYQTLYFTGVNAEKVYGAAVPLTFGDYGHVGNSAPRDGNDLLGDLMNGIVLYRGTKYEVSALDRAIFSDVGLPVISAVPEPSIVSSFIAGALLLFARRKYAARRTAAA